MNFQFGNNGGNSNGMHFAMLNIQPRKQEEKKEDPPDMDSIVVDIDYIISEKPSVKIVREFMRENLASIKSPEDEMFEND